MTKRKDSAKKAIRDIRGAKKGPPVIDGPDFAKTIKAFMDSLASAL